MNGRERVIRAIRYKVPDRVPFDLSFGFTPPKFEEFRQRTGSSDPGEYFGSDNRTVGTGLGQNPHDYGAYHIDTPTHAHIDEWGVGHIPTISDDAAHSHLEGFVHPLPGERTVREIIEYPLPDISAAYRYKQMAADVARLQTAGYAVTGCMDCTIFEIAWYIRGMERLLMDFIDDPEPAVALLDRITDLRVDQARQMVQSGVDILRLGDDIASQRGMLMSMPTWLKWLKPRLARVIAAAREANPDILIFYHSDGNVTAAVSDLIDIGVQILNPIQPECMDLAALKAEYGTRLSYWGTIGTQTTLPFGTPDDVRAEVKKHIQEAGCGCGLVLAPTRTIEPEVPWENILAFVSAVKEYGSYSS